MGTIVDMELVHTHSQLVLVKFCLVISIHLDIWTTPPVFH